MKPTIRSTMDVPAAGNAAPSKSGIQWDKPLPKEPPVTYRSTMMAALLALVLMLLVGAGLFAA